MKVTFLGTAAATAMPLPFCKCNVCREAKILKDKDIRKRASVVINDDMLIDLGSDSINACYQYDVDIAKIKYIVQTHAHSDHFDAGHFITRHPDYATQNITPITVIASHKTFYAMNKMLKDEDVSADLFCEDFQKKLKISLKFISHSEEAIISGYSIIALESLHDANQEAMIYLITYENKTVLYGTDLLDLSEEAYELLKTSKIDILILDQTYGVGYNAGGHLDSGQLITILYKLRQMGIVTDATRIYATHISHEGNNTHKKMQSLAKEHCYDIAYDGLVVTI